MTVDPIRRLLDEHVALQQRFEPLRRALESLASGRDTDVGALLPALRDVARVMTTELIDHAEREDHVLFPAVEQAVGGAFGPTAVMREEHAEIATGAKLFRDTLREVNEQDHPAIVEGGARLRELVEGAPDAAQLRAIGGSLIEAIDRHFAKEEQILFPMARQILDPRALAAVGAQMDEWDAKGAPGRPQV